MDEKQALAAKTLFVRNLPYSTKDENLEAVFGQYGPLKSCFTVKERGVLDKCRGFGYVIFALREDAEKALSSVKAIGGRPVQVTYANKKPPRKPKPGHLDTEGGGEAVNAVNEVKKEGEAAEEPASSDDEEEDYETITARRATSAAEGRAHKTKLQRAPPKYEVGKVVVLSSLPLGLSEKSLRKQAEKGGEVVGVVYPVPGKEVPSAYVTYKTHKAARAAVALLNGLTLKGSMMSAMLLSKELKPVSKKTLKKSRIIIRNLSFACTEEDMKTAFAPFGEIVEVHIPRKPNGHMLGYAFVQFSSYHSARNAIAGQNMKELKGRPVAVDWVVPRDKYKEVMQSAHGEGGNGGGGVDGRGGVQDGETKDEWVKDGGGEGGIEVREGSGEDSGSVEQGSNNEEGIDDKGSDGEEGIDGKGSDGEEGIDGKGSDGEEGIDGKGSDGKVGDDDSEGDDSEGDKGGSGQECEAVDEENERGKISRKKQLKEDVHEGKTLFVRNVPYVLDEAELKDHFAQFGAVRYCRAVFDPETGMSRGSAFVQFFDVSSVQRCMETEDINYQGRKLEVSLALSKKELEGVKQDPVKEKVDKRNLLLAKEGVILPDSLEAKELPKADLAKRMKAYTEKKAKLKNPNFFVSRTRLSVRNIPTKVDEKELRKIFLKAAGPEARLKQVKLMRSKDRVNSEGIGRSQGYGFVEFMSHEAALGALSYTNNNPNLFPSGKRLVVEFAMEDSRVVKVREQRKLKQEHFRQHGYTMVQKGSKTAAATGIGTKHQHKVLPRQGRQLQRPSGNAATTSSDRAEQPPTTSDKTTLKRKRKILGVNSIASKKSKGADSCPKPSRDSAGAVLKSQSQAGKEQPKMKQKQRMPKTREQKTEAAFATILDKYRQKLATGAHNKWTSEQ